MTDQEREDGMSRVEEIRERLEAATDGPWKFRWNEDSGFQSYLGDRVSAPAVWGPEHFNYRSNDYHWVVEEASTKANAELCAHAPTDLQYLLRVAERARAYVRAMQESNFTGYEFTDETRAGFKLLVETLEALDD